MLFKTALSLASGLLVASRPVNARPASCNSGSGPGRQLMGAAYLITNEDTNSVLSLSIDAKGMLGKGSVVATGGCGAASIDGSTMQPAKADPLVSQSALTVAGKVSLPDSLPNYSLQLGQTATHIAFPQAKLTYCSSW